MVERLGWVALPDDRRPTDSNLASPPGLEGLAIPLSGSSGSQKARPPLLLLREASFQVSRLSPAWGSCGHGLGRPDVHPVEAGTATKCTRAPGHLAELQAEPQGARGICGCLTKGPGPGPKSREQAPLGRHSRAAIYNHAARPAERPPDAAHLAAAGPEPGAESPPGTSRPPSCPWAPGAPCEADASWPARWARSPGSSPSALAQDGRPALHAGPAAAQGLTALAGPLAGPPQDAAPGGADRL